jgi:hypothetical protein
MGNTKAATRAAQSKEKLTRLKSAGASGLARATFTMMQVLALLGLLLPSLAGCFDFNKTFPTPTVTFQIVVSSLSYGGTYVWNSQDGAYEATVGGTLCSVYMDSGGTWHLNYGAGNVVASSIPPLYRLLPPTSGSGWSGGI